MICNITEDGVLFVVLTANRTLRAKRPLEFLLTDHLGMDREMGVRTKVVLGHLELGFSQN